MSSHKAEKTPVTELLGGGWGGDNNDIRMKSTLEWGGYTEPQLSVIYRTHFLFMSELQLRSWTGSHGNRC